MEMGMKARERAVDRTPPTVGTPNGNAISRTQLGHSILNDYKILYTRFHMDERVIKLCHYTCTK